MSQNSAADDRLTLTIQEAAKLLGIGRNSCYEAARRGDLPTVVIGRRILISRQALHRMLEQAGNKPSA